MPKLEEKDTGQRYRVTMTYKGGSQDLGFSNNIALCREVLQAAMKDKEASYGVVSDRETKSTVLRQTKQLFR